MKKLSHCLSPMLGLVASLLLVSHGSLYGQTAIAQQQEEHVNWEELEPNVPSLSQAEFDAQLENWKSLQKISLQQYLDTFQLFLETSVPRYEMQPYVLAECLWFQVAVLPQFQQVEADGSLDAMMELNMTRLPDVQKLVSDFFVQLGEGSLPVHPWSDTVFSLFQQLVQEFPVAFQLNQGEFLLVKENLPELMALKVEQLFMPVDVSFRNVQLYGGLMALDKLVAQFNEAKATSLPLEGEIQDGTLEQVPADGEIANSDLSLLPPIPGIDWQQVVENQPLMYLLAHSTAGREIYSVLRTYHSGETGASRCEELYQECCKIGEQWGFDLEQLLPSFSAAGISAVKEDAFILYCLPSHDLEQIATDLSCVKTLAPVYFSRAVELLRRDVSSGGAL
ncbi:MAG: hypothetical protein IKW26_07425 [Treponema sp.]|nr:hypothetical protein [Treponema sp.]